eukprot:794332-Rhodomonas_salina.1
MKEEGRAGEALGESIRHVERASTLNQDQDRVAHQVPHKVPSHVNVQRKLAVDRIICDGDARRIVLPHH